MKYPIYKPCAIAFASICSATALAQSNSRDIGWEGGLDAVYQDSQTLNFNGGSQLSIDDDIGLALRVGYRVNPRLELQFSLDWQDMDYDATLVSDAVQPLRSSAQGELEVITPRVNVHYNFLDGAVTPYVSGGIGWSFIDTNVPDAPPMNGCWWDPWWGYVCGTFQTTRNVDEFTYQAGAGVRWDFAGGYTMRMGYEKQWLDLGEASSTPSFDQFKLGVMFRY
jgi:opacity protein-like surface antigen